MALVEPQHQAFSLLDSLYDGVATADKWPQAMQGLGAALGGISVSVVMHYLPTNQLSITDEGTLPDGIFHDFLVLNEIDPARAAAPMLAAGQIYIDHEFYDAADLRRMPFYRDFLRLYGVGHYALIPAGGDATCTRVLSILRESGRSVFDAHEQQLMHAVQPHLRHALNLRQQLGHQQQRTRLFERAFDTLSVPLLACSTRGGLAMANAAGREWASQAGCPLGKAGASPQLRGLLEQACGVGVETPRAGSLMLSDGDVVVVLPFAPKTEAGIDALALVAVQGERWRPVAPEKMLRTLFSLTPAEIRLVQHLALHDEPLTVAAEKRGVSLNTLRTQLKAIFQKTLTCRQSDLLRLVWQLGLFKQADNSPRQ